MAFAIWRGDMTDRPDPGEPVLFGHDRFYGLNFGHVIAQHVLDAHLQRRGAAWATCACAVHFKEDHAVFKTVEDDITAVLCNRRAHTGIKQFLDLADQLIIALGRRAGAGSRIGILVTPAGLRCNVP